MANPEHVAKLKEGVKAWNKWRLDNLQSDEFGAEPWVVDLDGADLQGAHLYMVNLSLADLKSANLENTVLVGANLHFSNLIGANLAGATLISADLTNSFLHGADLSRADLANANLSGAKFNGANLDRAKFNQTAVLCTGLASALHLNTVEHRGPSYVATSTLVDSQGLLPEEFLKGCGLSDWETYNADLHAPDLCPIKVTEIQQQIFDERMKGFFLCGVFISYSQKNNAFADRLHTQLQSAKANVWLDRHDLVAGPLTKQIDKAIRINDVLLLVLSKDSVKSEWVAWELDRARRAKEDSGREILCPVALDESWKQAAESHPRWNVLTDYNILDFSDWENDESFGTQFKKLFEGIKRYYATDAPESADA